MLLSPLSTSAQNPTTGEPEINALWILDDNGVNAHAYRITFADNSSFDVEIEITHIRDGTELETYELLQWKSIDSHRVVDIFVNTTLQWADEVTVTVDINAVDLSLIHNSAHTRLLSMA